MKNGDNASASSIRKQSRVGRELGPRFGVALCIAAVVSAMAAGGMARPQVSAGSDAERGAKLFGPSCGFCHGAEGGGGLGPNLTGPGFFTKDDEGKALGEFLKTGRPSAGMPPFPTMAQSDVAAIYAFIRTQSAAKPKSAVMSPESILVGDPAAGRAYFEGPGRCTTCHSVTGDLKGVGSHYNPLILQGRIINPRVVGVGRGGSAGAPPASVKVTLPNDELVTGQLVQVNDFFVTLIDQSGNRRTIARNNDVPKVEVDDPAEAHRQMMLKWKDRDMWNVTAYLASLK